MLLNIVAFVAKPVSHTEAQPLLKSLQLFYNTPPHVRWLEASNDGQAYTDQGFIHTIEALLRAVGHAPTSDHRYTLLKLQSTVHGLQIYSTKYGGTHIPDASAVEDIDVILAQVIPAWNTCKQHVVTPYADDPALMQFTAELLSYLQAVRHAGEYVAIPESLRRSIWDWLIPVLGRVPREQLFAG